MFEGSRHVTLMREVYCGFRWLQFVPFDKLTLVIISNVYTKKLLKNDRRQMTDSYGGKAIVR